jgi:hypothetical protein
MTMMTMVSTAKLGDYGEPTVIFGHYVVVIVFVKNCIRTILKLCTQRRSRHSSLNSFLGYKIASEKIRGMIQHFTPP